MVSRFCPLHFLRSVRKRTAIVILNKSANEDSTDPVFWKVWKDAEYRACADGGANYVYDLKQNSVNGETPKVPDLVCGDFDSIRPEVKQYFEKHVDSEVTFTPNQDETDFTKCIQLIAEKIDKKLLDIDLIIALAGRQDRCDHTAANISTLYKAHKLLPERTRLCLIYSRSYMTLLKKGITELDVATSMEGEWCSLIPFGHPAIVTASGLKWNMNQLKLEFGEIISTSNELDSSGIVCVETDQPLIWAMSFKL